MPRYAYRGSTDASNDYPVSKTTWWAGVKSGRYPQPVKRGPKTTAWKVQDIVSLIDEMGGDGSKVQ